MSASFQDYVGWFRQSSPYINAHRGKTFVVSLPGEALEHENFAHIVHDLALLESLGVRLVLVHGARPQIDRRLSAAGQSNQLHCGLRVTEAQTLPAVVEAIAATRVQVEAALSTGLPNSPMHGAQIHTLSGNFVTAMPQGVIEGVDLQHTGKVRRVDTTALDRALSLGSVVLLSPLGYSPSGEVFNMTYTEVASQVASALGADKLIAFVGEPGVVDADGQLVRELSVHDCERLLEEPEASLSPEMTGVLSGCFEACRNGVTRAQLIPYATDGALLHELFTRDGTGTMVHLDRYEQLRTATIDDIGGVLELIAPLEREGILVRRSRELLETEIEHFTVLEKDGTVIACAALYPFGDSAELACVATHPDYRNGGRAAALLHHLEEAARIQGVERVFVLTTRTAHWFVEQGFRPAGVDDLPIERKRFYNDQRNAKVFIKSL